MPFALGPTSVCSVIGDSNTVGSPAPADGIPFGGLLTGIKSRFCHPPRVKPFTATSGTLAAPGAFPRFVINGNSGRAIGDVSADIMAVVGAGSTSAIILLGLNEALRINGGTLTLGEVETQMRDSLDDLRAGGVESVLWVGPYCSGEKHPRPHVGNNYDARILAVDALQAEILEEYEGLHGTYAHCSLVSLFDTQEPILNVANEVIGPFTSDGVHFSSAKAAARALVINTILASIGTAA